MEAYDDFTTQSVLKKPDLVVAMDIGSTYSGYAWQWRGDFKRNRSNVEFNDNWNTAAVRLRKTTTCLLLNEEKEVEGFGQAAEQMFCNECDRANGASLIGKWYFFKGFKMKLYNQPDPNDIQAEDHFGQHMPLKDVMSKFIGALRTNFLNMMRKKSQTVNLNKTLWVITVPAIWSEPAKKLMSSAAIESGINRKNLLIANEPEAAALHCIHLSSEHRLAMDNFGEKGDSFLTVDLGGGTTDVLALKVRDDGFLEEISMGAGGMVGAQDINNAFFQACTDAFKRNDWDKISQQSHAEELLEMENDFESKKVAIGSDNPRDEHLKLSMPEIFQELLESGEIQLKQTDDKAHCFKIQRKKFVFDSEFIRETLFNETIRRILEFLREILSQEQVKSVKHVVLVGGFSESPIVVKKVKELLDENFPGRKVVVPTSPFTAVMSGAVLYGHDPMIFRSRISRATYGVRTNHPFKTDLHREDKKWTNKETDREWCKDIFHIHVRKGTSVKLGEKQPSEVYHPKYKDQTSMGLPIYMSTADHFTEPVYTTDDHCKKIGNINVEMPDTTEGTNRKVTVTMIYGGTELDVIAKNETSGEEHKATLRFDTS